MERIHALEMMPIAPLVVRVGDGVGVMGAFAEPRKSEVVLAIDTVQERRGVALAVHHRKITAAVGPSASLR